MLINYWPCAPWYKIPVCLFSFILYNLIMRSFILFIFLSFFLMLNCFSGTKELICKMLLQGKSHQEILVKYIEAYWLTSPNNEKFKKYLNDFLSEAVRAKLDENDSLFKFIIFLAQKKIIFNNVVADKNIEIFNLALYARYSAKSEKNLALLLGSIESNNYEKIVNEKWYLAAKKNTTQYKTNSNSHKQKFSLIQKNFRHLSCNNPEKSKHLTDWNHFAKDTTFYGTVIGSATLAFNMRGKLKEGIDEYQKNGDPKKLYEFLWIQTYELVWSLLYAAVPSASQYFRKLPTTGKYFMDIGNAMALDYLYSIAFRYAYRSEDNNITKPVDPLEKFKKNQEEKEKFIQQTLPSLVAELKKDMSLSKNEGVDDLIVKYFKDNLELNDKALTEILEREFELESHSSGLEKVLSEEEEKELDKLVATQLSEIDYRANHGALNTGSLESDLFLFHQLWLWVPEPIRQAAFKNIKKTYCLGNTRLAKIKYIVYQTMMYVGYWNARDFFASPAVKSE